MTIRTPDELKQGADGGSSFSDFADSDFKLNRIIGFNSGMSLLNKIVESRGYVSL
ncbi:hypothetical protein P5G60_10300 [Paenibacillus jamilae]|nr:hypothetical protein [Paenibacillus jamilae]